MEIWGIYQTGASSGKRRMTESGLWSWTNVPKPAP